uniref:Magnesium transporter n=1 Tax=Polytomella parva TaxID=51329 RepID=A0A7S0UPT9_9CHLO|mmetsp:Transcript_10104/g.18715  ORF Transcript_10104/g.18715 Transcript_10104/m.18715 type:complete len:541 (+) Transcript_10104:167-1789(+)
MRKKMSFSRDSRIPPPMRVNQRPYNHFTSNDDNLPVQPVDEVQIILDACTDNFAPERAPSLSDLHPDLSESQHQKEASNHFHNHESGSSPDNELEPPTDAEAIHMSFSDVEQDDIDSAASGNEAPDGQANVTTKTKHRTRTKKGKAQNVVLQTWLKIDKNGESSTLQADKWRLTHKLGVQLRDMRLLDPNISTAYTSAILCRDKAIIVNIEHVKAIITTDYVLVINHEDEKLSRFIEDLKRRLRRDANASTDRNANGGIFPDQAESAQLSTGDKLKMYLSPSSMGLVLPFELKVLEVCLDVMAGHLDFLTAELESAAYPALDSLAGNTSSQHLERVRRIKNALVRLTNRVDTLRGLLEKFMDDDEDMHDLHLTAKELHEEEERKQLARLEHDSIRSTGRSSNGRSSSSSSRSSRSSNSSVAEAETAVVEMILEAYYMHLDNTYNKLQTLHEYVGDTEDLVNIQLDQHRNKLIFVDMMITAYTACLATMSSISGWFGMNLASGLSELPYAFKEVVISSNIGGIILLLTFCFCIYRSGLISL